MARKPWEILQQLDRAWNVRGDLTREEWDQNTARLRDLRDRLNRVCELLHRRHPNGMSVHGAIGLVARDFTPSMPRVRWAAGTTHPAEEFDALKEAAHRLDLNIDAYRNGPAGFALIRQPEWSNGWQESVLGLARVVPAKIASLESARDRLLDAGQLAVRADNDAGCEMLTELARAVLATHGKDFSFAFAADLNEKLDAGGRFVEMLREYRDVEGQLSVPYAGEAARRIDPDDLDSRWSTASGKFWLLARFAKRKVAKQLAAAGGATSLPDVPSDSPRLRRMKGLLAEMDGLAPSLAGVPGYAGLSSQTEQIGAALTTASKLKQSFSRLAGSPDDLVALKAAVKRLVIDANDLLDPDGTLAAAASALEAALADYRENVGRLADLCMVSEPRQLPLEEVGNLCASITGEEARLRSWCAWCRARGDAIHLQPLVAAIEDGTLSQGEVDSAFLTAYARWFAAETIDREPVLRDFVSAEHMDSILEFRSLDDRVAELAIGYARTALADRLPARGDVGRKDGYGILKHELQKKRRHKPLRQLITEMGDSFGLLAPCMLMSPLSIAQYLPVDQQMFDLVIFDEASQIAPWDAVGSIARGKQVVIAGDPRQMPPTNFFKRGTADGALDDNVGEDLESILDECLAVGIPRHSLSWHYRSRHESLIAFSNIRYYGGNLITFPAAETRESAVTWRRVDGTYGKGRSRTNQAEAKALVDETVRRLLSRRPGDAGGSIGIITLNTDQQALIEDLLDTARREHPEIEPFFDESLIEPVFVKNLETVQGDERDVILLGIGYGPSEPGAGTMSMNFGPLNRDGGERRLNVAVTRSRREMVVFTSFDPSMIDLNRTSARAVRDLKHFLEFAERGPRALGEAVRGPVGGYDSPFEEAVARRLGEHGWQVVPQVGVSRFRIDLGVVHPDRPGDFIVGVECDGATYHSAATARDRDKIRAAVLEGLGWNLVRVWSTDWFVDPEGEVERLDRALDALLEADRAAREAAAPAEGAAVPEEPVGDRSDDAEEDASTGHPVAAGPTAVVSSDPAAPVPPTPSPPAAVPGGGARSLYRVTGFGPLADRIQPESFHDGSYTPILLDLVRHTLQAEAPISDDLLVNRMARAHGFKRSGRLIRNRVLELVDQHFHLRDDPVGGCFVWLDENSVSSPLAARTPSDEDSVRPIESIPAEEICAGLAHIDGGDPPVELARLFGITRLSPRGRERIEAALGTALQTTT